MDPKGKQGMYSCGSAPPKSISNFNISNMVPTQTDTDHNCTFQATSKVNDNLEQIWNSNSESDFRGKPKCPGPWTKNPPIRIDSNVKSVPVVKVAPLHVSKKSKKNLNAIWFVDLHKTAKNLHTTIQNNSAYHGWYQCPFDPNHRIKKPVQFIKHAKKCIAMSSEGFNGKLPKKRALEWTLCQYNHNHLVRKDCEPSHLLKNCIF